MVILSPPMPIGAQRHVRETCERGMSERHAQGHMVTMPIMPSSVAVCEAVVW